MSKKFKMLKRNSRDLEEFSADYFIGDFESREWFFNNYQAQSVFSIVFYHIPETMCFSTSDGEQCLFMIDRDTNTIGYIKKSELEKVKSFVENHIKNQEV